MPPPRKPGRPRKPESDRKIERSVKGRLNWEPGSPHPLDVMFTVAGEAQAQLTAEVDRLVEQLAALQQGLRSPDEVAGAEEHAARQTLHTRFERTKHYDHLLATMAAIRRTRLAARFAVATAALDLVRELLSDLGPSPEEELVALISAMEHGETRRQAHVAQALAQRLADFEQQIHAQREHLVHGAGWFEWHSVRKARLSQEAKQAMKENKPLPDDPFEYAWYGPYLNYRWRDGKGPKYTVHLGRLDDEEE